MSGHRLWHDPGVDRACFEEIFGLLYGLLIRLDDRLSGTDVAWITQFIEANELGLACVASNAHRGDQQPTECERPAAEPPMGKKA